MEYKLELLNNVKLREVGKRKMKFKAKFLDGKEYFLNEYFPKPHEDWEKARYNNGIEVTRVNPTRQEIWIIDEAKLLHPDAPDAKEHNQKELKVIERFVHPYSKKLLD